LRACFADDLPDVLDGHRIVVVARGTAVPSPPRQRLRMDDDGPRPVVLRVRGRAIRRGG
jgi:hypothetical protein